MNFISLQCGTSILGVLVLKQVNSPLWGFSYFELFKFPNSALRFINVVVSARCMLSTTMFISQSAEVAKTQHRVYITFRRSCENATSIFRELWYQYRMRHTNNKQLI